MVSEVGFAHVCNKADGNMADQWTMSTHQGDDGEEPVRFRDLMRVMLELLAQFEQAWLDNGAVDLTKLADDSTCRVTSFRGDPSDAGDECVAGEDVEACNECVASEESDTCSECVASEDDDACDECVASEDDDADDGCVASEDNEACSECVASGDDEACDECVASEDDQATRGAGRGESRADNSLFEPGMQNCLADQCWTAMPDRRILARIYNRLPRVGLRGHERPPDYCAA